MGMFEVISISLATLGFIAAIFQVRATRKENFSNRRPYVICSYRLVSTAGKYDAVHLEIANVGNTPAYDVKLCFEQERDWHWVRPADFPFLPEGPGISVIAPGGCVTFFVGPMSPQSVLKGLKDSSIKVTLRYYAPIGRSSRVLLKDSVNISLQDYRFRSKS